MLVPSSPMASTLKTPNPSIRLSNQTPIVLYFPAHLFRCSSITIFNRNQGPPSPKPLSPSSSFSVPPTSKEQAVLQAKTCISKVLRKPFNNPYLTRKSNNTNQQRRFRVEIPIIDDSPASISCLAFDVFGGITSVARKAPSLETLMLWPNPDLTEAAIKAFEAKNPKNRIRHINISSANEVNLNTVDLAIFLVPEAAQLGAMEMACEGLNWKAAGVIFNPRWEFDEEDEFGDLKGFVGSFETVYSFLGLEVKGILSKKQGVVFKCGEEWRVLIEEDEGLKVVSRFKVRPSMVEVENVLYNKMAIKSPLTKSVKFLRDLVLNVTGGSYRVLRNLVSKVTGKK